MLNGSSSGAALERMVLVTLYEKKCGCKVVYHQAASDFLLINLSAHYTHLIMSDTCKHLECGRVSNKIRCFRNASAKVRKIIDN